ncbi:hypothetical protein HOY80DRAFT_47828 [Tuber brumale]|nr:hypothetical protein HOY80DRAFT_47828 [Tuber brumale]
MRGNFFHWHTADVLFWRWIRVTTPISVAARVFFFFFSFFVNDLAYRAVTGLVMTFGQNMAVVDVMMATLVNLSMISHSFFYSTRVRWPRTWWLLQLT